MERKGKSELKIIIKGRTIQKSLKNKPEKSFHIKTVIIIDELLRKHCYYIKVKLVVQYY